jgi:hypothetical protein
MFAASKTDGAVELPDAQFNYVTMLLHGDGTNGAQNNTFIDSSTNNLSITRSGSTTQGSFSPYGSNWSNYFLGTGNYLSLPSNAAFNLGTGAYTVEAWVYLESYAGSNEIVMFCNGNATGAIACSINTSGQIYLSKYGTGQVITGSSGDVPLNQWNHIAYVRTSTSSNDTKLYVNGVVKATGTDSNNWNVTTTPTVGGLTIGGFGIIGYISNVRVVKGTAVYTGAFTPSTTPLTAISGTSLLTCQSNCFIDNSSNAFAITSTGTPRVQRFNPFGTSTAYSTSVIGGSGYFDGTGDYLSIAPATAIDVSTGDFTVEFWANPTQAKNSVDSVFGYGSFTMMIYHTGSDWSLEIGNGSSNYFTLSTSRNLNAWTHIAITRSGNTFTFWKNGVSSATATNSGTIALSSKTLTIGWNNNTSQPSQVFTGYINDFRIVKGTALYTTAFTPPTAPLTAITNTSLLTNFTNGAILDNAMMNDLETAGNAQISTSVKKYGTGSLAFDGTGDRLVARGNPAFNFGSGDFTVECWLYLNSVSANQWIVGPDNTVTYPWVMQTVGTAIRFISNNAANDFRPTSFTLTTGTWNHFAVTRSGSTMRWFTNGTLNGSQTYSNSIGSDTINLQMGTTGSGSGDPLNGYIDDLRITKGVARYTSSFTAPIAAFADKGSLT